MRLSYAVLLVAAILTSSGNALSTVEDSTKTHLLQVIAATEQNVASGKRSLRAHHTATVDGNEEERGVMELKNMGKMIKLEKVVKNSEFKTKKLGKLGDLVKNSQYRQWLEGGEDPKTVYKLLGFTGMGPAARTKPRYIEYLEFSKLWRAKKGVLAKEWWQFWKKGGW